MRNEALFEIWAPADSPWAAWAKPALFATMRDTTAWGAPPIEQPETEWLPSGDRSTAVVVDLPGAAAVATGLALARRGYRPVPLFNGCDSPGMIVDVAPIARMLAAGAAALAETPLPHDAAPAFLLDANRLSNAHLASPGCYDNRWAVVPQDIPSAARLTAGGIRRVVLRAADVQDDLAHVLRRYQEGGLPVDLSAPGRDRPERLDVPRPRWLRSIWARLLVLAHLRRNAAGGFGALIPIPGSSGMG